MLFAIIAGLVLLATIIGLDIHFAMDGIKGNTWSEMIRKLGFVLTFIPWAWGGLGGHFFHPNWKQIIQSPGNIAMMVWLSVVVTMIGGVVMKSSWPYAHWVPYITFFVAAIAIGKLWPAG